MNWRLPLLSALVCGLLPTAAAAQYLPGFGPDPATGETYHVEIAGDFWSPSPDIVISSEALGIIGTEIDFVEDLGIEKSRFGEFRAVLRPGRKHKFRVQYLPIDYEAEAVLQRTIVFNGIAFDIGLPVASSLSWRTWRFGYEYDFLYRDRGFLGFVVEAKYTDVEVNLESVIASEFARARGPIPAIGLVGRVYPVANISLTGEFTGFKIPDSLDGDYQGQYFDFDLYATLNFVDQFGVQLGYRSLDVSYVIKEDSGDLTLKGLYFGAVARF